ncbi:MAG: MraY family glycosyltransferase [Algiphilus sp.]|uniref:glycosyltransferase family 4 protein n=1 Tax=Algiphilus sp. TaxID=1872431 RepID=UPI0032EDC507
MLTTLFIVLTASVVLNAAIVLTARWHIQITGDSAQNGAHKAHTGIVPRIGGAAVFAAAALGVLMAMPKLYPAANYVFAAMTACVFLMFGIGFLEDVTKKVRPTIRYSVCIAAALIFSLANAQLGVKSVDVPLLDAALAYAPVSVLFFAFAVAGMTHACNLIDGQNGLCAGYAIMAYLALGLVAGLTGQAALAVICEVVIAANLGFLFFNFPQGRIFLGDGGAYMNGALIAILAVMVVNGGQGYISPWFALAVLVYPVTETLHSMVRRCREGRAFYEPDDAHLHHLLRDWLETRSRIVARFSALVPLGLSGGFMVLAVPSASSTPQLAILSAAYLLVHIALYHLARSRLRAQATVQQLSD